jgi:hypothetical protein
MTESFGAPADARNGGAGAWQQQDLLRLRDRARAAREAAAQARGYSQELRLLLGERRHVARRSRCASCGRTRIGDRWIDAAVIAPLVGETPHVLCDDCSPGVGDGATGG